MFNRLSKVTLARNKTLTYTHRAAICSRTALSTLAMPNQETLKDHISLAERITHTGVMFGEGSVNKIGSFIQESLSVGAGAAGVEPGARCIVLSSASGSKRAAPVMHFLRRAGYLPLLCELSDNAPIAAHTITAQAAAKRTGSTFVVAVGGSAIVSVGRAVASLLTNGGKVMDYATSLGGKNSLTVPSLPFMAVLTCPSGLELTRESYLLCEGRNLAILKSHNTSVQSVLVDPSLSKTLEGVPSMSLCYANMIHALEAYVRQDSDTTMRKLSWMGLELGARSLLHFAENPNNSNARTLQAASSLLTAAAISSGPLGPVRALGLAIASRFSVSYSHGITSVAPGVMGAIGESLLDMLEEDDDLREAEQKASSRDHSPHGDGDSSMNWRNEISPEQEEKEIQKIRRTNAMWMSKTPNTAFMSKSPMQILNQTRNASKSSASKGGDGTDELMSELLQEARNQSTGDSMSSADLESALEQHLREYAKNAEAQMTGRGVFDAVEDSDIRLYGTRFAHASTLLNNVASEHKLLPESSASDVTLQPYLTLEEVSAAVNVDGESTRSTIEQMGIALDSLRLSSEKFGIDSCTLEDYGFSTSDLGAVAATAEMDENNLSSVIQLRKAEYVSILQEA